MKQGTTRANSPQLLQFLNVYKIFEDQRERTIIEAPEREESSTLFNLDEGILKKIQSTDRRDPGSSRESKSSLTKGNGSGARSAAYPLGYPNSNIAQIQQLIKESQERINNGSGQNKSTPSLSQTKNVQQNQNNQPNKQQFQASDYQQPVKSIVFQPQIQIKQQQQKPQQEILLQNDNQSPSQLNKSDVINSLSQITSLMRQQSKSPSAIPSPISKSQREVPIVLADKRPRGIPAEQSLHCTSQGQIVVTSARETSAKQYTQQSQQQQQQRQTQSQQEFYPKHIHLSLSNQRTQTPKKQRQINSPKKLGASSPQSGQQVNAKKPGSHFQTELSLNLIRRMIAQKDFKSKLIVPDNQDRNGTFDDIACEDPLNTNQFSDSPELLKKPNKTFTNDLDSKETTTSIPPSMTSRSFLGGPITQASMQRSLEERKKHTFAANSKKFLILTKESSSTSVRDGYNRIQTQPEGINVNQPCLVTESQILKNEDEEAKEIQQHYTQIYEQNPIDSQAIDQSNNQKESNPVVVSQFVQRKKQNSRENSDSVSLFFQVNSQSVSMQPFCFSSIESYHISNSTAPSPEKQRMMDVRSSNKACSRPIMNGISSEVQNSRQLLKQSSSQLLATRQQAQGNSKPPTSEYQEKVKRGWMKCSTEERNEQWLKKKTANRENLIQELREKELSECTFRPIILRQDGNRSELMKSRSNTMKVSNNNYSFTSKAPLINPCVLPFQKGNSPQNYQQINITKRSLLMPAATTARGQYSSQQSNQTVLRHSASAELNKVHRQQQQQQQQLRR